MNYIGGLGENINLCRGVSDESTVTLMPKQPFLPAAYAAPPAVERVSAGSNASLEEERREIVESVLGALAGNVPDPDEMAACSHLLKHLAQTARLLPPGRPRLTL